VNFFGYLLEPVRNLLLSTDGVPSADALSRPWRGVFHLLHTPYDYYERISF
jgi:hypothetical protein